MNTTANKVIEDPKEIHVERHADGGLGLCFYRNPIPGGVKYVSQVEVDNLHKYLVTENKRLTKLCEDYLQGHLSRDTEINNQIKENRNLKKELEGRLSSKALRALLQFAIKTDDGITMLNCWMHGEFDTIRKEWPDCPEEIFESESK